MSYIKDFNRFEIKYLLGWEQYIIVRDAIKSFCVLDQNSAHHGFYPVRSLYFDSPDFRFYWEKIEGECYRRKLRARIYDHSGKVFMEIKQRINKTLQKRRTLINQSLLNSFISDNRLTLNPEEKPIQTEILYLKEMYNLEPKIIVSYLREAFFAKDQEGFRITFDKNLDFEHFDLDLFNNKFEENRFLPDTIVVMELKFNNTLPIWVLKILNSYALKIQKISKYCSSCEKAFPFIISQLPEPKLLTIEGWRTRL